LTPTSWVLAFGFLWGWATAAGTTAAADAARMAAAAAPLRAVIQVIT
jgi:hypothetical protein